MSSILICSFRMCNFYKFPQKKIFTKLVRVLIFIKTVLLESCILQ